MNAEVGAGIVFLAYIVGVFGLAILSNKLLQQRSFLSEYFLGSRGLGTWAFAFTFAATAASGGSFTGFPALIYSHGWVLALWIASYMVVPIVTMGLLGKRLNQMARRCGAITIPDVLRERYASPGLAVFATITIIFLTITNLVSQFKAGGVILDVLLMRTPGYEEKILPLFSRAPDLPFVSPDVTPGYFVALMIFSVTVIFYTSFGGFRAVVWTDVMQGVVMGVGVIALLPCAMWAAGGLERVTRDLHARPPRLVLGLARDNNAMEYVARPGVAGRIFVQHEAPTAPHAPLSVAVREDRSLGGPIIHVSMATNARGAPTSTAREVQAAVSAHAAAATLVEARIPALGARADGEDQPLNNGAGAAPVAKDPQCLVAGYEMIYGPGRTVSGAPFHPLPLAISFFFMWAISGAGQPGTMVRLMAFKDSITWRRAIFTVTIYFGMIYFPLVVIFVAAQGIIHPAELSLGADQIMPTLAIKVAPPLIAGILIAAPFAAVMSTVDSFLLVISSGLVRDIYQRTIRPTVAERTMKLASFSTTAGVGILVAVLALNPPRFLQTIIVFTGAGFAATFLAPFFLGAYWKRMNALGAWSAMFCGFVSVVLLSATMPVLNRLRFDVPSREIHLFGLHPLVIGLALSFAGGIIGSLLGPPLPRELERRFFAAPQDAGAIVEP